MRLPQHRTIRHHPTGDSVSPPYQGKASREVAWDFDHIALNASHDAVADTRDDARLEFTQRSQYHLQCGVNELAVCARVRMCVCAYVRVRACKGGRYNNNGELRTSSHVSEIQLYKQSEEAKRAHEGQRAHEDLTVVVDASAGGCGGAASVPSSALSTKGSGAGVRALPPSEA